MTVYPQEFKLDCVKIGFPGYYDIRMNLSNTALLSYTSCFGQYDDNCPGFVIEDDYHSYSKRYTVNITWDGMTVISGSISQSTTGDQVYACEVAVTSRFDLVNRAYTLTIKGTHSDYYCLNESILTRQLMYSNVFFFLYFSSRICSYFS